MLVVLVDRWRWKDDQSDTKKHQDGPPREALGNGPKQDCAC